MSASTISRADVVTRVSLIDALREQLLQPRRTYLRHRAPRSKYVAQLRRDIARGQCKPIAMLMAVMLADVEDGVPASLVTQWLESAKALVEAQAVERQRTAPVPVSLLPLHRRETRAQAALDEAQLRALAEPDNADALEEVAEKAAEYDAAESTLLSAVRQRWARLTMQRA